VAEGIGAAAVTAIIDELEADHAVWEAQAAVLQSVVGQGRAGQDVDWRSPASEAYLAALESWVRDGTGLLDAADGVLAALRAHLDALREVRDSVALAESAAGDALTGPLLPELLREGGLL
jgi:hypothetical protein